LEFAAVTSLAPHWGELNPVPQFGTSSSDIQVNEEVAADGHADQILGERVDPAAINED